MQEAGISCRPPDDGASGGKDFSVAAQVRSLKDELRSLADGGRRLYIHLAPPCFTFSRARDRKADTRVRSMEHPEGIPPLSDEVA